jgi:hypothetical protein
LHAVAAQQEADVKKNESVAASSILECRRHPILVFYIAQKDLQLTPAARITCADLH